VAATRHVIDVSIILLFGLIWLCIVTVLRVRKKARVGYLLSFTVFYIYLYKVLDYTLFQFQSLLLLKYFMPGLMLNGLSAESSVNLVPLITLGAEDLRTSLLNILLMMPFGFGLALITNYRMIRVITTGAVFSIVIELLQLVTGSMAGMTFRVADINDVIFNTAGVAIGYVLFAASTRVYPPLARAAYR
jgi:glycopeptide antibiotics resistance protein